MVNNLKDGIISVLDEDAFREHRIISRPERLEGTEEAKFMVYVV